MGRTLSVIGVLSEKSIPSSFSSSPSSSATASLLLAVLQFVAFTSVVSCCWLLVYCVRAFVCLFVGLVNCWFVCSRVCLPIDWRSLFVRGLFVYLNVRWLFCWFVGLLFSCCCF